MRVIRSNSVLRKFPQMIKTEWKGRRRHKLSSWAGHEATTVMESLKKKRRLWQSQKGSPLRRSRAHREKQKEEPAGEDNVFKVPALQRKLPPNISRIANAVRRGGQQQGNSAGMKEGIVKIGGKKTTVFVRATLSLCLFPWVTVRDFERRSAAIEIHRKARQCSHFKPKRSLSTNLPRTH